VLLEPTGVDVGYEDAAGAETVQDHPSPGGRRLAGTIARTADHALSCNGATVGDSMPGVIAHARSRRSFEMS
jgi:hypothetical protein